MMLQIVSSFYNLGSLLMFLDLSRTSFDKTWIPVCVIMIFVLHHVPVEHNLHFTTHFLKIVFGVS